MSQIVLKHALRHPPPWLIFDVRQKIMRIRRAQSKDLKAIIGLDRMTHADRQRKQFVTQAFRENAVHVLEHGGIRGYSILRRNFFHRYFLEMLFIGEDHRREGLGEKLIAHAESIAMKRGELWTSTNRSNQPMHRLLRKRGFRSAGRVIGLDADDPELFYVKKKPNKAMQPTPVDDL